MKSLLCRTVGCAVSETRVPFRMLEVKSPCSFIAVTLKMCVITHKASSWSVAFFCALSCRSTNKTKDLRVSQTMICFRLFLLNLLHFRWLKDHSISAFCCTPGFSCLMKPNFMYFCPLLWEGNQCHGDRPKGIRTFWELVKKKGEWKHVQNWRGGIPYFAEHVLILFVKCNNLLSKQRYTPCYLLPLFAWFGSH